MAIYNLDVFRIATNSLAVQVTMDGGVFVLDAIHLTWRQLPLAGPGKKNTIRNIKPSGDTQ